MVDGPNGTRSFPNVRERVVEGFERSKDTASAHSKYFRNLVIPYFFFSRRQIFNECLCFIIGHFISMATFHLQT